jgi:hypothetical protein
MARTSEFWDQPRIAAEFGVALNTVQSSWRNATIRVIEDHVRARSGGQEPEMVLGLPVARLTADRWRELRRELRLAGVKLPAVALPLPDTMTGTKPGWAERTIQDWASATRRRDQDGRLGKAKSPGRPPGVVETRPRRRAADDAQGTRAVADRLAVAS